MLHSGDTTLDLVEVILDLSLDRLRFASATFILFVDPDREVAQRLLKRFQRFKIACAGIVFFKRTNFLVQLLMRDAEVFNERVNVFGHLVGFGIGLVQSSHEADDRLVDPRQRECGARFHRFKTCNQLVEGAAPLLARLLWSGILNGTWVTRCAVIADGGRFVLRFF